MQCPLCHSESSITLGKKEGFDIHICSECGLGYASPMPTASELDAIYSEYGMNSKALKYKNKKISRWFRRLYLISKLAPRGRSLDIGCNTGFTTEATRKLGFRANGIDLGQESISMAQELFPSCSFTEATAQDFVKTSSPFEFVTCSEVIEHLIELDSFGEALNKLVVEDGILYLTTPDLYHFLVPKDRIKFDQIGPPHHLIYFGKKQMRRFLEMHGFKVLFFVPVPHKANLRVVAKKVS